MSHYDTQRGIEVPDAVPNPGDIRTDAERRADIAAEEPRHDLPKDRGFGLGVTWDGNGTPIGQPLDAGAAAAERARIVEGKPLTVEQEAERALNRERFNRDHGIRPAPHGEVRAAPFGLPVVAPKAPAAPKAHRGKAKR